MSVLRRLWQRAMARAPRRLHITRAGRALIAIALGAGLAALNTGNNLLFLAWGMVLSGMVVSGVLSEATLRPLEVQLQPPDELRAQLAGHLRVRLRNASAWVPALAVETIARWRDPAGTVLETHAPYQLRIGAGVSCSLYMPLRPHRRGALTLESLEVRTAYPFGFFVKSRPLPVPALQLWVLPAPGGPQPGARGLRGRLGQGAAGRAGDGDDFFAVRPYRVGDAPGRVLWRRVARTGRWVVAEREASLAQHLVLLLQLDAGAPEHHEAALSAAGSLIEALLQQGLDVGLVGHGVQEAPVGASGDAARQRRRLLMALARLQPELALPEALPTWATGAAQVALEGPGLAPRAAGLRLTLVASALPGAGATAGPAAAPGAPA